MQHYLIILLLLGHCSVFRSNAIQRFNLCARLGLIHSHYVRSKMAPCLRSPVLIVFPFLRQHECVECARSLPPPRHSHPVPSRSVSNDKQQKDTPSSNPVGYAHRPSHTVRVTLTVARMHFIRTAHSPHKSHSQNEMPKFNNKRCKRKRRPRVACPPSRLMNEKSCTINNDESVWMPSNLCDIVPDDWNGATTKTATNIK